MGRLFFDDDDAGPTGINTNARLVSPVVNLTGVTNPKLSFNYANMIYDLDSTLKVEVFNGASWIQVFTFSGEAGVWNIDLNTLSYVLLTYATASNIDLSHMPTLLLSSGLFMMMSEIILSELP